MNEVNPPLRFRPGKPQTSSLSAHASSRDDLLTRTATRLKCGNPHSGRHAGQNGCVRDSARLARSMHCLFIGKGKRMSLSVSRQNLNLFSKRWQPMSLQTASGAAEHPRTGIAGLIENWRSDILSGFLVFLIALPLCLGIAMASGFPPQAGIITAIVGGLLVSRINGSFITIAGPAAGLIVVILDSVQELGEGDAMAGYRYTLAAVFFAGLIQILMGVLKAGKMSAFFPSSAVHGMLAAIGIIIMAKQIHVMLGVKPDASTLFQTIGAIPASLKDMNPEVASIGFLGLGILTLWTFVRSPRLKMIPAPLIVVLVGMGLAQYFDLDDERIFLFLPDTPFLPHHEYTIGPKFLVAIPNNFLAGFAFPDFAPIFTLTFWAQVVAICLVGSLETLLSAAAVDKLDPYRRTSNLNRDLAAVGLGNIVCGLIGGLPMIAEIVRS